VHLLRLGRRDHRDHPVAVGADVVDRDEVGGEVPPQRLQQAVGELVQVEQPLDVADQFEQLCFLGRDAAILVALTKALDAGRR